MTTLYTRVYTRSVRIKDRGIPKLNAFGKDKGIPKLKTTGSKELECHFILVVAQFNKQLSLQ